jgi:hypothetical protein
MTERSRAATAPMLAVLDRDQAGKVGA